MPVDGGGIHRVWYTGGRWAYASALIDGFTDYIFITIDMSDPTKPREAGRCWIPGMNQAAGETPGWPATSRFGLHHAIIHGDTAYAAWRDAGMVVIDVADRAEPKLDRPSRRGAAVRRRHAQLPAAARPRPAHRPRRGRARPSGGRRQAHLGLRQPREIQSGQHCDVPAARRGRLQEQGRPFRPAQHPREPAGQLRELGADLRDLSECRRAGVRHPRPASADRGRRLGAAGADTHDGSPARTVRASSSRPTSSSMRPGSIYSTDYNAGLFILEYGG